MDPLKKYQLDLQLSEFQADPSQKIAIEVLNNLYYQLMHKRNDGLLSYLMKPRALQGIYLWGRVGTGKTYLMDTFYNCLNIEKKTRTHFHKFMCDIHQQLNALQGEPDPLQKLAQQLRKKVRVICFDEFLVNNIADAMLLGRLFKALFAEGIVLVASSNVKLADLYKDGLQYERFLPTINLLKKNLQELNIDNSIDYRLQRQQSAGVYFFPLNDDTELQMKRIFMHYTNQTHNINTAALNLNKHCVEPIAYSGGVIWFDFKELCTKPRNTADYLSITHQFHTVLLSKLATLDDLMLNAALRFINLIDIFYDEQIRLVISAAKDIERLYSGTQLAVEFKRTASRLYEMRGAQYLEKALAKQYIELKKL